jgi:hypothetical protein
MITHLTGIPIPAYPHIPITPWKRVRCCMGSANSNPYPYLCIPVDTLSRVYPDPCHTLVRGAWERRCEEGGCESGCEKAEVVVEAGAARLWTPC